VTDAHVCCGCNDEEAYRAGERAGNPLDGWIGEREEVTLNNDGIGYHFLVPRPLAEYVRRLEREPADEEGAKIEAALPHLSDRLSGR
jgi:hypothetical protein